MIKAKDLSYQSESHEPPGDQLMVDQKTVDEKAATKSSVRPGQQEDPTNQHKTDMLGQLEGTSLRPSTVAAKGHAE